MIRRLIHVPALAALPLLLSACLSGAGGGAAKPPTPVGPVTLTVRVHDFVAPEQPVAGALVSCDADGAAGQTDAAGAVALTFLGRPVLTCEWSAEGYRGKLEPYAALVSADVSTWLERVAPAPLPPNEKPVDPPANPPDVRLPALRVEPNARWFQTSSGVRFDWREISAFALLSRQLAGEEAEVVAYLARVRQLGFTMVRVILTLDGPYWTSQNPTGRSLRAAPDMPRYWEALDRLARLAAAQGLYMRAVLIGAVEPFGGTWYPDRRDVWSGDVRARGEAFALEAASRLAAHPHVVLELANEPGQIGMRESFDDLIALGRAVKARAPGLLLGGGAVDGPNDQDTRLAVEPFDYVDAHIERRMAVGGFEWVKRSGEYALIDQPQQWPDGHPQAGQPTGIKEMPFISGEPVNFGEWRLDGRNDDVERSPAVAFAYGAVSRSRQYNTTFHYDGGLWATAPKPETVAAIECYMAALNAYPMTTDGKWRGHWSPAQGNYWNRDAWPATDDTDVVLRHVREGRGPWRVFGSGPYSVAFPEPNGWRWEANVTAPVERLAACSSGDFSAAVYKRQ